MRRLVLAVPGSLDTPTGGYAYDRRVAAEIFRHDIAVDVLDLGTGFPSPTDLQRSTALEGLKNLPAGVPVVVDGLACGVLPEIATVCHDRPVVALVHHPLACESGLAPEAAAKYRRSERAALAAVHRVIVTSETTARLLAADYAVPRERITVAPPGLDRRPDAATPPRQGTPDELELLAVGAVIPRKGYDVLVAALAGLKHLPWRLTIAGALDRDAVFAARLFAQINETGLETRIVRAGAVTVERLACLYGAADLFVLPSRYEGYGMVFSEAASYGLAMIGTTGGATPETIPPGAGLLVAPDDVKGLSAALHRLITDHDMRSRCAAAALAGAATRPTWDETAERILAAVRSATDEARS
ncbi:Glycosyl transferase, group 1 [Rhodovulum sp. PH10]|uniref:glycosyltransferase family 4 protein n=1 Tax=Rhodovulum sp. PH10 TaxID=1187851 RepID=UPI00027C2728|nr:glycosyltransferase family 4 protein [Rhodovulum sp. PH10]EJW13441.1 Glycosyl transferase, group 1 [Rhodovulum sp. PH10]